VKINNATSQGLSIVNGGRLRPRNRLKSFFGKGWEHAKEKRGRNIHFPFAQAIQDLQKEKVFFIVAVDEHRPSLYRYAKKMGVELTTALIVDHKIKVFLKDGKYAQFLKKAKQELELQSKGDQQCSESDLLANGMVDEI
jgi:hypothetical protein